MQQYSSVCLPAGGLGQDAGELTVSMDAVVFVVVGTGDVQATSLLVLRVLFYLCGVNTHIHIYTQNPQRPMLVRLWLSVHIHYCYKNEP